MSPTEPLIIWEWVFNHLDLLAEKVAEHVVITVIAVLVGLAIAFPVALLVRRRRALTAPVLGTAGVLYVVPSLALFGVLIPVTGIGLLTAEIALVSYTLLILIRNIVAGLDGIPPDIVEAARGVGFGPGQRLWRIELPLAFPVILVGIRIATVTTIGLVAVTALIGQGGLGFLIITIGIGSSFPTAIWMGVILSVALAALADTGLSALGRVLTPWSRARAA